MRICTFPLEGKQHQKGHHQRKQAHRLGQGKAQDGVGENLLLQGGIPCVSYDKRTEHCSNAQAGSSNADRCQAGSNEFGRRVYIAPPAGRREVSLERGWESGWTARRTNDGTRQPKAVPFVCDSAKRICNITAEVV